jgi:hypothetical protein
MKSKPHCFFKRKGKKRKRGLLVVNTYLSE